MTERKRLSDILRDSERARIDRAWQTTRAAEDFAPLPSGEYVAHIITGELFESRSNSTPGYKLTFEVVEGEHAGRRLWHDLWLTPAAMGMTKRDLAKIGISSLEQLDRPLPPGMRCAVKVALRTDDAGTQRNHVRSFSVIGIDSPERDPFAPPDGEGVDP